MNVRSRPILYEEENNKTRITKNIKFLFDFLQNQAALLTWNAKVFDSLGLTCYV